MIVTWQCEDGYVGGSRPHRVEVPDDELAECETEEEREQMINDYVEEDFRNKVSWSIISKK